MKYSLFLLTVFFFHFLHAQKQGGALIDSLTGDASMKRDDTNKVKTLIRIEQTWLFIDPVRAIGTGNQALSLAEKLKWKRGIANLHNDLGLAIGDTGNNTLARKHFLQSLDLNTEMKATAHIITNLNNISRSFQRESDFAPALEYGLRAMSMARQIGSDEQISLVGTVLSSAALAQKDYPKARQYATITLEAGRRAHAMRNVGTALLHLGAVSVATSDTPQARKYYDEALDLYAQMQNPSMTGYIRTLRTELFMDSLPKALSELQTALQILEKAGPTGIYIMNTLGDLGVVWSDIGGKEKNAAAKKFDLDKSAGYFRRALALARENKSEEYIPSLYQKMSEMEERRGNYAAALELYRRYFHLNDSLFSQEKKNELAGLEGKQNLELKDREIALSKLEVSAQHKTQLTLLAGIILMAIIGVLLFWQSRTRKKSNRVLMTLNGELDEANKIKARFFGILSHDLRSPISNLVNFLHLTRNEPGLLSPEEQRGYRREIGAAAGNLLETMETMLLWSKEQMDHFRPERKLVPVDVLFDYLQKFFGQTTGVSITFSNPDGLTVSTDENYLKVIMQNLTSNAVKALNRHPAGTIHWQAAKKGDRTVLSVTDNGPGVSADQIKSLYAETTTANARTGFGFHLIRDLARAIQYSISIESAPGTGTTFILSA